MGMNKIGSSVFDYIARTAQSLVKKEEVFKAVFSTVCLKKHIAARSKAFYRTGKQH